MPTKASTQIVPMCCELLPKAVYVHASTLCPRKIITMTGGMHRGNRTHHGNQKSPAPEYPPPACPHRRPCCSSVSGIGRHSRCCRWPCRRAGCPPAPAPLRLPRRRASRWRGRWWTRSHPHVSQPPAAPRAGSPLRAFSLLWQHNSESKDISFETSG